jgi:hypothetical protein
MRKLIGKSSSGFKHENVKEPVRPFRQTAAEDEMVIGLQRQVRRQNIDSSVLWHRLVATHSHVIQAAPQSKTF